MSELPVGYCPACRRLKHREHRPEYINARGEVVRCKCEHCTVKREVKY